MKNPTKSRNIELATRFQQLFPKNPYNSALTTLTQEFNLQPNSIKRILRLAKIKNHNLYDGKFHLQLADLELLQLHILINDCGLPPIVIKRYQILLLFHEGLAIQKIALQLKTSKSRINHWIKKFLANRHTLPTPDIPFTLTSYNQLQNPDYEGYLTNLDPYYDFRYQLYCILEDDLPKYHKLKIHSLSDEAKIYLRRLALTNPQLFDLQNLADLKYQPTHWTLTLLQIAAQANLQPQCLIENTDPTPTDFPALDTPLKISMPTLKSWFSNCYHDFSTHPYWNPQAHDLKTLPQKQDFY